MEHDPALSSDRMTLRIEEVGRVTAFFGRPSAAVVSLSKPLRIGDTVYIKGHTTDFLQRVTSLQLSKRPVEQVEAGQLVGFTVTAKCRRHDVVYNVLV